jgi:predicted HicB family RNase H-like nuclease
MAQDVLKYKGFIGSVRFNTDDDRLVGRIEEIPDLVTFQGQSVQELKHAFHAAVDDYIQLCAAANKPPLRSFKGSFNIRISPDLHRYAARCALESGISLNQFVQEALEREVRERSPDYRSDENPAGGSSAVAAERSRDT